MHGSWPHDFQHWPTYLPFPTQIPRSKGWVPNRQSFDWPQSQWAPLYLPPGSGSFQPYRYGPNGPLTKFRPTYRVAGIQGAPNGGEDPHWMSGRGGDTSQLPPPYSGVTMPYARFNTGDAPLSDEFTPADPLEDAATTSFQPFEPELLEGLSERMLTRLQRLETLLTKMEAADLGTPATKLESQLLRMHEHIRSKLEKRMERRANRTGKSRRKLKRKLKVLRARRKVRRLGGSTGSSADRHLQVQKAKKIQQIREHHAAGKISTGHANYLIRAAIAGKRPTEARDIAIEAGGVRKVGVVERAIASGAKDRFTSRRIAV